MLQLMGCRGEVEQADAFNPDNPLDAAASDAHLIVDPRSTSPVGLYQRDHVAGTDGLCVSGDEDGDSLRFGIVMHFGPTLVCEGSGSAAHSGASLSLRFDGADCAIDAEYDGQRVQMPGTVPSGCAALCGERASMSGGSMARTGWTEADAQQLRSRRDVLRNRASHALCEG